MWWPVRFNVLLRHPCGVDMKVRPGNWSSWKCKVRVVGVQVASVGEMPKRREKEISSTANF